MSQTAKRGYVENADESIADDQRGETAAKHTAQGSVRERRAKGVMRDHLSLLPDEKKLFDEKFPGWKPAWARGSRYSDNEDRVGELCGPLENGGKEAQVVYKSGEFDRIERGPSGDLVLMAIPPEVAEDDESFLTDCHKEFEYGMYPETEKDGHSVGKNEKIDVSTGMPYNQLSLDDLRRMALAEHEFNQRSGLTGGQTRGLGLIDAERLMRTLHGSEKAAAEALEREQAQLRGGYSHTEFDKSDLHKMMVDDKRGVRMLFGDTGLGKTNQQRLAERGKGKQV